MPYFERSQDVQAGRSNFTEVSIVNNSTGEYSMFLGHNTVLVLDIVATRPVLSRLDTQAENFPHVDLLEYADADLYVALLLRFGHGYPQWIPRPDVLVSGHEEHGVSIGDVGIVTPDQSFDFLFNICNDSDSTINQPHGLPSGTDVVSITSDDVTKQTPMWSENTVICSHTMDRKDTSSTPNMKY